MYVGRTFSSESIYIYEHKPMITCSQKDTSNPALRSQLSVPYKVQLQIEMEGQISQILQRALRHFTCKTQYGQMRGFNKEIY